jgi:branched-chain amino acid transport system ATP-binding protein
MTNSEIAPAAGVPSTVADALELRGLTCGYGRTTVLRDVSLTVPASSITVLLGPNGAGKSTLLNAVSGFVRVPSGTVFLDGVDVSGYSAVRRAGAGLCHIPERRGIFRSLTVRENLLMQSPHGQHATALERAVSAFPILGKRMSQAAGTLSGGQQQMLAIVRAYIRDPKLILIDEASLGLAPIVVDEIFEFLQGVCRGGTALLLVDQFVARALEMADRAYLLARGSVAFTGTAAELRGRDIFADYLSSPAGRTEFTSR